MRSTGIFSRLINHSMIDFVCLDKENKFDLVTMDLWIGSFKTFSHSMAPVWLLIHNKILLFWLFSDIIVPEKTETFLELEIVFSKIKFKIVLSNVHNVFPVFISTANSLSAPDECFVGK